MRKKLVIALASVLGLVLIGGLLLLWNLNPIIEKFKPQIISILSSTLKQPVEVGKISATIFPNVAVQVQNVKVNSDTAASPNALAVADLTLKCSLLDLLSGKLSVSEIGITNADLSVRRDSDGRLFWGEFALTKAQQKSPPPASAEDKKKESQNTPGDEKRDSSKSEESNVSFGIQHIRLKNIGVTFIDKAVQPPQTITLTGLGGELSNVDVKGKADVNLSASFLGKGENLSIKGQAANPFANSSDLLDLKLKLSSLDLKRITELLTVYKGPSEVVLGDTISLSLGLRSAPPKLELDLSIDGTPSSILVPRALDKSAGKTFTINLLGSGSLDGQVEGKTLELKLDGATINAPFKLALKQSATAEIKSSGIELEKLSGYLPPLKDFSLVGSVEPNLKISTSLSGENIAPVVEGTIKLAGVGATLQKAQGTATQVSGLTGSIAFAKDSLSIKQIAGKVAGEALELSGVELVKAGNTSTLRSSTIKIFGGTITLNGKVEQGASGQTFQTTIGAKQLAILQLMKFASPDSKIALSGTLDNLTGQFRGSLADVKQTLTGGMNLLVVKGSIEGINILGETLKQVGQIPGVADKLSKYIPEKARGYLESDSTAFDSLSLDSTLGSGAAQLQSVELKHSLYVISGRGSVGFDGGIEMKMQLKITPELADDMVAKQKNLKALVDSNGNIVIPVVITKRGAKTVVVPDVEDLLKRAAAGKAKDAATKALDKLAPGLGETGGKLLQGLFK